MTSDDPYPKASMGRPSLWDEAQAPNFFTPSPFTKGDFEYPPLKKGRCEKIVKWIKNALHSQITMIHSFQHS